MASEMWWEQKPGNTATPSPIVFAPQKCEKIKLFLSIPPPKGEQLGQMTRIALQ